MRRILTLIIAVATLFIFPNNTSAIMNFSLDQPNPGLAGNSMGDIVYDGKYIWVGTGDGLSYSPDSGKTWFTYNSTNGLNADDISALAVFDSTLWVACAYTKMIQGEPIPYGKGFNKTTDRGKTWESYIPEQVDFAGKIAYDIAFDDSSVWAACWYGGLIHSWIDHDTLKWENVFVDDDAKADYEGESYEYLNNRFFSVVVDTFCPNDKKLKNSITDIVFDGRFLWVATQNGLHAIDTDKDTLTYLTFDTSSGLAANGVYSLTGYTSFSDTDTTSFLCVGVYTGEKKYELPFLPSLTGAGFNNTTDYGASWDTSPPEQATALEKFAYGIAIADTVVWAACGKGGLIRSFDSGKTWENVFVDDSAHWRYEEGNLLSKDIFISVAVDTFSPDTTIIWAGTEDGLYRFVYGPGYVGATDWIEGPGINFSLPEVNKVIIPNTVYKRFGYGHWDPPDSIHVNDFCYPDKGINPGDFFEIPIILDAFEPEYKIGGFEFEVDFDYIDLTFYGAERGCLLDQRRYTQSETPNPADSIFWSWEYFSYRVLPCPTCPCCKYKILLYGQTGMPDGPLRRGYCLNPEIDLPETYWAVDSAKYYHNGQVEILEVGASLVWLKFQVANNESLRDSTLPLIFEWEHKLSADTPYVIIQDWDCAENTMFICDGNDLYVSNDTMQYRPLICGTFGNPTVHPILNFANGGVHICADSLLNCIRGDINMDEVPYSTADAVLFSRFFVYGLSVFAFDQDKQVCATDVTIDDRTLMLTDLVYLVRIIQHDATPGDYGHLGPSSDIANVMASHGRITVECASAIGGILFKFDGNVTPTLLNANMELLSNEGNVLVWSSAGHSINAGASQLLTASAKLVSVIAVDREGRDLATTLTIKESEFPTHSIVSLGIQKYDQNKIIWASVCYEGTGAPSCSAFKSTDGGETWTSESYLADVWVRDFAFQESTVWAATDHGLKRMKNGNRETFDILDTLKQRIIPSNFTSVCTVDSTIWAGTVDGLVKSTDDGEHWQVIKFAQSFKKAIWAGTAAGIYKFIYNYRDVFDTVLHYNSYSNGLTGDFVVSTAMQRYKDKKTIWAGTQPAYSGSYSAGISTNDGDSWSVTLEGDQVWNFAFDDSVVWAATSSGLKRSYDGGENWDVFNYMKDKDEITKNGIFSTEFTSVAIIDKEVWAGNADGLVKAPKDVKVGEDTVWNVFRTSVPIGEKGSEEAYAYPSPFSPVLSTGGVVRIHYKPQKDGPVTIKIYDFAMNLVITLRDTKSAAGIDQDKEWDGKNDKGDIAANGVYFFKVEAPGGQTEWGKLVILK